MYITDKLTIMLILLIFAIAMLLYATIVSAKTLMSVRSIIVEWQSKYKLDKMYGNVLYDEEFASADASIPQYF